MRSLFYHETGALSQSEIDDIRQAAKSLPSQEGRIFSTDPDQQDMRHCIIKWVRDSFIQNQLYELVQKANDQCFGCDVINQADMQYVIYDGKTGGHYDWHHDVHFSSQDELDRKLSVTVPLSDPADYEGGLFEFDEVSTNADFRAAGSVLIFPSYLRHKVNRVTKGERHALVAWFFGPRWR